MIRKKREWTCKTRLASLIGPSGDLASLEMCTSKTFTLVSGDLNVSFFPSSSSIQPNNPEPHAENLCYIFLFIPYSQSYISPRFRPLLVSLNLSA
jgi:hypothetical protein